MLGNRWRRDQGRLCRDQALRLCDAFLANCPSVQQGHNHARMAVEAASKVLAGRHSRSEPVFADMDEQRALAILHKRDGWTTAADDLCLAARELRRLNHALAPEETLRRVGEYLDRALLALKRLAPESMRASYTRDRVDVV